MANKQLRDKPNMRGYSQRTYINSAGPILHMRNLTEKVRSYRAKYQSLVQRFDARVCRIDDYKRIMMFLASNDIVRLSQLLSAALRRGSSPTAILQKLIDSVNGLYNPRTGFTTRNYDLAFLCKAIGGPRLLFSFQKAFGLISERTLKRGGRIPSFLISTGIPSEKEISQNIQSFLDPSIRPFPIPLDPTGKLPGYVLMFDDIALESKCRYCPNLRAVVGLCREHSHHVDPSVTDFESLQKIRDLLVCTDDSQPRVCLGKNATVVAVASCSQDNTYTPTPIVISPTDGKEKWYSLAKWIRTTLDSWREHEFGDPKSGPIWTIASDGDSTFRRARHFICTEKILEPSSELGSILSSLQGLNLHTSREGITATSDPKHVFKRFATALRSEGGITVQNTVIQPSHTLGFLQDIPEVGAERARRLLDPADKQNVPKAVELIQRLMSLHPITPDSVLSSVKPSLANRRRMLEFVGQFMGFFLRPFIALEMSLSRQLESISTFAHLFAIMWLTHKSTFLSSQLYADTQAIVKNIFFTVARLQIINPNHHFYLIHEGSDRLEGLFSKLRTLDHARNFDARQLAEKISVATLVDATYARNPDLDRGHRRLNVTDTIGVDHLNPRAWIGDTRVGNVNIPAVWAMGQAKAVEVVKEYLGSEVANEYNFTKIFAPTSGRDLLRPLEPTSWVGITELKRDIPDAQADAQPASSDSSLSIHKEPLEVINNFEDYLPEALPDDSDSSSLNRPLTLDIDGKSISIDSLASKLGTNNWKRVTMRTLRVQGRTIEHLSASSMNNWIDADEADSNSMMKMGDLGAVLTRVDGILALAVIEVTKFKFNNSGAGTGAIKYTELTAAGSQMTVVGQVCRLLPSTTVNGWEVLQKFIPICARESTVSKPQYILQVPGKFIRPLSPNIVINDQAAQHERLRWLLQNDDLEEKKELLWDQMNLDDVESASRFQSIHIMPLSEDFPYRNADGNRCFITTNLPKHLIVTTKFPMNTKMPCFICGEELRLKEMRNHVGRHILSTFRGQVDTTIIPGHEVGLEPCGFCGLDGCSLQLSEINSKSVVTSSCLYQPLNWSYKSAVTGTPDLPCTNVPIYCELCPKDEDHQMRTIWRYNTIVHMILHHEIPHPTLSKTYILPKLPGLMLLGSYISSKEEKAMGISPEAVVEYRDGFGMMKSDDPALEAYENSNPLLKPKRKLTVSVVMPQTKKIKEYSSD